MTAESLPVAAKLMGSVWAKCAHDINVVGVNPAFQIWAGDLQMALQSDCMSADSEYLLGAVKG